MNKLTRKEAESVLQEAYRLKAEYGDAKSRLGQALYWVSSPESQDSVKRNLYQLLEYKQADGIDFYFWTDDNKVIQCFYEHFVEQY